MTHFRADRVAEQRELNGGQPDHHPERDLVAPHLDELLAHHGPKGPLADSGQRRAESGFHDSTCVKVEPLSALRSPPSRFPSSFFCNSMNTSSTLFAPNC